MKANAENFTLVLEKKKNLMCTGQMWFSSEANAGCNVILDFVLFFFFGESRRGDNDVAVRVFVIIIGGIGIGFGFGFGFGHFPVRTRQRQTKAQPMASKPRMGSSCPSSQKRLRI